MSNVVFATYGGIFLAREGISAGSAQYDAFRLATLSVDQLASGSVFTKSGGTLYFTANDYGHGDELWRTDGTSSGTLMLGDVNPGLPSSSPSNLTDVNGTLFFTADDGIHGRELWKTDGTLPGTMLVNDLNPGSAGSNVSNLTNANGTLFFTADDGVHGVELWRTDGTSSGTSMLGDIAPGSASGGIANLTNVNGTLFFTANDRVNGIELWKSDGTVTGTVMVADIAPGAASSSPRSLKYVNGKLLFLADDGTHGVELWTSDGTSAGTGLVTTTGSGSVDLARFNGDLLWTSGGYPQATDLVQVLPDVSYTPPGTSVHMLDSAGGSEYMTSDGSVLYTSKQYTLLSVSGGFKQQPIVGWAAAYEPYWHLFRDGTDTSIGPRGPAPATWGQGAADLDNQIFYFSAYPGTYGTGTQISIGFDDLDTGIKKTITSYQGSYSPQIPIDIGVADSFNHAPKSANTTVDLTSNVYNYFGLGGIAFSDVDGDAMRSLTIHSLPASGHLFYKYQEITAQQASAGFVVTSLNDLFFAPDANTYGKFRFDYTVRDTGGTSGGGSDTSGLYTFTVNVQPKTSHDFNGDAKADLLWHDATNGDLFLWDMNGAKVASAGYLGTMDPTLWSATSGDFNGDLRSDLLWQDKVHGDVFVWTMNDDHVAASQYVGTMKPTDWALLKAADLNGDGKTDLLWQDLATNNVYLWDMNKGSVVGGGYVATMDPGVWTLAAASDFTGDGKADLLWQKANGDLFLWTMNDKAATANGYVTTMAPSAWTLAATGDFNGDGKTDLLWQEKATGNLFLWDMNGSTPIANAGGYVATMDPGTWHVAQASDFDGDGKTDLLWQDTAGNLLEWSMNDAHVTGGGYVATMDPAHWMLESR